MSKFDREFLIPYLKNICALYFAQDRLNKQQQKLFSKVNELKVGEPLIPPKAPEKAPVFAFHRCIWIYAAIAFLTVGIVLILNSEMPTGAGLVCILFSMPPLIGAIIGIRKAMRVNKTRMLDYRRLLEQNEKTNERNIRARQQIPELQSEIQYCKTEYGKIDRLIQNAYFANVIPGPYRSKYAIVFLYDWFSTSSADDLDVALNMFALEEIKSRLDAIIKNQSEMILNQCMMLVNQQEAMQEQEAHNRMMREKVAHISASLEDQNRYLSMIDCNAAAAAYFATADYIRNL